MLKQSHTWDFKRRAYTRRIYDSHALVSNTLFVTFNRSSKSLMEIKGTCCTNIDHVFDVALRIIGKPPVRMVSSVKTEKLNSIYQ